MADFILAASDEEYEVVAGLFRQYAAWLNIDLGFQHFEEELEQLKGMYALPFGGIILCRSSGDYVGCVAIRKIDDTTAELKRMYVLPHCQGKGIGNELLLQAIQLAIKCNYKTIRLDTLSHMTPAMNLYKKNGFYETPAYYYNPQVSAIYFEKML